MIFQITKSYVLFEIDSKCFYKKTDCLLTRTALHLAAALGNAALCHCLAWKNPKLVAAHNDESETLLFLAALRCKKSAFLCLHFFNQEKDGKAFSRKNNGDKFLHCHIWRTLQYVILIFFGLTVTSNKLYATFQILTFSLFLQVWHSRLYVFIKNL